MNKNEQKFQNFVLIFLKKKYYHFIELKKLIELAPWIGSWIPVLTEIGFNDFLEILKNEQKYLFCLETWIYRRKYRDSAKMSKPIEFLVKNYIGIVEFKKVFGKFYKILSKITIFTWGFQKMPFFYSIHRNS